jgi:hypothetical protein
VIALLADANIEGYVDFLVALMQAEPWKLFWDDLQLRYLHFADVGLVAASPDSQVWQICQQHGLFLITDNRNKKDSDSLEATIRTQNTTTSLPVFTVGDIQRLRHSNEYAKQIIEALFQYLQDVDNIRGTGRLYLP